MFFIQGDQLLLTDDGRRNLGAPQNVSIGFRYPRVNGSRGNATVTSIEAYSSRSNDNGGLRITEGDIGRNYINVILDSYETDFIYYEFKAYGIFDSKN